MGAQEICLLTFSTLAFCLLTTEGQLSCSTVKSVPLKKDALSGRWFTYAKSESYEPYLKENCQSKQFLVTQRVLHMLPLVATKPDGLMRAIGVDYKNYVVVIQCSKDNPAVAIIYTRALSPAPATVESATKQLKDINYRQELSKVTHINCEE